LKQSVLQAQDIRERERENSYFDCRHLRAIQVTPARQMLRLLLAIFSAFVFIKILASETCSNQVLKQNNNMLCPEGYGFPASKAVCVAAAQALGFDGVVGEEGPYGEDNPQNHPPCFHVPTEIQWVLPGYCGEVTSQWLDLGAVCVKCCGGCFECMECEGMANCSAVTEPPASGAPFGACMSCAMVFMMVVAQWCW
ncbi:unnamed protein product, partial [Prorocentrum cordatum]